MERIKEALDRARKERSKEADWLDSVGSEARTSTKLMANGVGQIVYTQSRVVSLPSQLLQRNRIIQGPVQNAYSDVYKVLRTQILQRMRERNASTLAITSPGPGEGKSLTALNLAISMAMELDKTVLLVDADMRAPSLHRLLGLGNVKGLSDYLTGDAVLSDLLVHPSIPRLVVLPAGKSIANSSEMLSSQRMLKLVQEMKSRYPSRYILFDLPPLLNVADAAVFIPHVETGLMVVEDGKTPIDAVKKAASLIPPNKLIGSVLNKVQQTQPVYGYGYGYDKPPSTGWFEKLLKPRSA